MPNTLRQKLLEVQKEVGAIKKDKDNPFFKSKYFDINSLLDTVKPVLNNYSIILLQPLITDENGKAAVKTLLMDADGEAKVEYHVPLPETPDAQKMGSAITYIRRYSLQSLLALEAEDDDGAMASGTYKPDAREIKSTRRPKPVPYKSGSNIAETKAKAQFVHQAGCNGNAYKQELDGESVIMCDDCKAIKSL